MAGFGARISAVVLAKDEAAYLPACLASLAWADEVLVLLDPASRDTSEQVARAAGARVEQPPFVSFPAQRNLGLALARGEWVLFVDADERVTPALVEEILRVTAAAAAASGYWIPRRNRILGHWMRGAGWSPDEQLRLLRRGRARYDESVLVHEVAEVDGPLGHLTQPLLHLNYASLAEFWFKQRRYSRLAAESRRRRNGRPRGRALVGAPARELWRRYVQLQGYRDGPLGLVLSLALAYFEWETVRLARAQPRQQAPDR